MAARSREGSLSTTSQGIIEKDFVHMEKASTVGRGTLVKLKGFSERWISWTSRSRKRAPFGSDPSPTPIGGSNSSVHSAPAAINILPNPVDWKSVEGISRLIGMRAAEREQLFSSNQIPEPQDLLEHIERLFREEGCGGRPTSIEAAIRRKKLSHIIAQLSACYKTFPASMLRIQMPDATQAPTLGGGCANVYKVEHDGRFLAVKSMRIFTQDTAAVREDKAKKLIREALIWYHFDHPYVLTLEGVTTWSDTAGISDRGCGMISPWMANGCLSEYMEKNHKALGPLGALRLASEVACGLHYLHYEGLIHGDLRGANILVDNHGHAILADFGLTVFVLTYTQQTLMGGAQHFLAPELHSPITSGYGDGFLRSYASDIYAFACVCYQIYSGKHPWQHGVAPNAIADKVRSGARPFREKTHLVACPDDMWTVITGCWKNRVKDRPDARQLLLRLLQLDAVQHDASLEEQRRRMQEQSVWPMYFNNDPAPSRWPAFIRPWVERSKDTLAAFFDMEEPPSTARTDSFNEY